MAERGELERLAQGVYATPAAVGDELTARRGAWLSLDPGTLAYVRLERPEVAGVISHASAAAMHGIGDILEPQIEVTLPVRYRPRREDLRVHRAVLEPREVTVVEGLPVTTAARTVADLVRAGHDRDHVASVVADALRRDLTSLSDLRDALEGVEPGRSGSQVLSELMAVAGLDLESLAGALMASSVGQAATLETVRLVSDWVRRAVEPLESSTRAHQVGADLGERLREVLGPLEADSRVAAQARRVGAELAERMRGVPVPADMSEWAADFAKRLQVRGAAPQVSGDLDLTKTWRALRLSEQLAGTIDDHDEDVDEDDEREDEEKGAAR